MKQLVFVFEVNKRRHPAAALRNAAADSIRSDTYNSLLCRDKAIAAWRQSNCCIAMQQSTRQYISGNKTNEMTEVPEVKMEVKKEVNSLRSWKLKWTIPYEQTASKANVQPTRWLYFLREAHNFQFNFIL